jgi:hypothetical protein
MQGQSIREKMRTLADAVSTYRRRVGFTEMFTIAEQLFPSALGTAIFGYFPKGISIYMCKLRDNI